MDLYKELNLTPVHFEPNVWVSRLVIFEKCGSSPAVIRDITLARGLNIIWAEETENDDSAMEISGHSAGKTTFCRFLRYVLGEKTFGTKMNMELIRKALPEGYVAAEVHVKGKKWAVRRPFGSGRSSYVKEGITVEELLQDRVLPISQDDYSKKMGLEELLEGLESATIVRTNELIQWGHILAWCTRDQEARFQNIYDWRASRSGSEAPGFRYPKEGPIFVMRAVLGLFLPEELRSEEALAELQRKKDDLEKKIEEQRREPQFRVNLYERELRNRLKTFLPEEQTIDTMPLTSEDLFPDLRRTTERAVSEMEMTVRNSESNLAELQNQIDEIGVSIRQQESDLEELNTLFDIDMAANTEIAGDASARNNLRQQIRAHEDKTCPFGGILIKDCSYVLDRQKNLKVTQFQDIHAMEQAATLRTQETQKIERSKTDLRSSIQNYDAQKKALQGSRDSSGKEIRKKRDELRDLRSALEALEMWTERRDQGTGYEELIRLRNELVQTETGIKKLEKELTELLHQHDQNRRLITSIFSASVRSVLSSGSYDGDVSLSNRELSFRITHGTAMSGEAVETLSVLLADIASLVYNTVSDKSHLPGIMLHDSPREADLASRIYRSFIRLVASLQESFDPNNIPFQYILTTTTAPPEELKNPQYVKLQLDASNPDDLLLKENIVKPDIVEVKENDASLFDT